MADMSHVNDVLSTWFLKSDFRPLHPWGFDLIRAVRMDGDGANRRAARAGPLGPPAQASAARCHQIGLKLVVSPSKRTLEGQIGLAGRTRGGGGRESKGQSGGTGR